MAGIVYALTNPAMPDLVRIGRTKNLPQRLKTLFTSGVPYPFVAHCAVEVEDEVKVESILHKIFEKSRVRTETKRDFFEVDPETVLQAMRLALTSGGEMVDENHVVAGGENIEEEEESLEPSVITEGDIAARNEQVRRRGNINLQRLQIPIDGSAVLNFVQDDNIIVKVTGPKEVEYEGEKMSLSKAAEEVFTHFYDKPGARSGPWYWKYKGELLVNLRKRLDEED